LQELNKRIEFVIRENKKGRYIGKRTRQLVGV
jgi:hypothetical protein